MKNHCFLSDNRIKKILMYILTVTVTLCSFGNIVPAYAERDFVERFSVTAENYVSDGKYSNDGDGLDATYISEDSLIMAVEGTQALRGTKSLRINTCDIAWNGLSDIDDMEFVISVYVKLDRNFNNTFRLMINTGEDMLYGDGTGGTLFTIAENSLGEVRLSGADGADLGKLEPGKVYAISMQVNRGSNIFRTTLNGTPVGYDFRFPVPVYFINGVRLYTENLSEEYVPPEKTVEPVTEPAPTPEDDVRTPVPMETDIPEPSDVTSEPESSPTPYVTPVPEETPEPSAEPYATSVPEQPEKKKGEKDDCYITVDDIRIYTREKSYVRMYSSQEPGQIGKIALPGNLSSDTLRIFVNTTEVKISDFYIGESTIYLSAEQFFSSIEAEYSYDEEAKKIIIRNDKVDMSQLMATVSVPGSQVNVNGKNFTLNYQVRTIDNIVMIPLQFISEVLNAKVWWDKAANMLVISNGKYRNDGVLRLVGGRFYMNGEPYYEISFNQFDLFENLMNEETGENQGMPAGSAAEEAERIIGRMHDLGFKSVRIMCGSDRLKDMMYDDVSLGKYFQVMDRLFDICDRHDVKIVVSMHLISDTFTEKEKVAGYGWINGNETVIDLVSDRNSVSRGLLNTYIEKFVNRYKSRNTILMYEIEDEANLDADVGYTEQKVCCSLGQLGQFYADCASVIKKIDPDRLVTGGDSVLRHAQWHLYSGVMDGLDYDDWTTDSETELFYAMYTLNSGLDAVSAHTLNIGVTESETFFSDDSGKPVYYGFEELVKGSLLLGKGFYNGKTAAILDASKEGYYDTNRKYLYSIIDNAVQISHWWTFENEDGNADEPLLEMICNANSEIIGRYTVNGAEGENTANIWNDPSIEVFDPENIANVLDVSGIVRSSLKAFLVIGGILLAVMAATILLFRGKKLV